MAAEGALRTVVLDVGSGAVKVGYAGEETPSNVFPCVTGNIVADNVDAAAPSTPDCVVGAKAFDAAPAGHHVDVRYPVAQGCVTDWDGVEKLYQHAFSTALCTEPSEHPVLLTEPPLNPPRNREAMTQIMFEQLEVPSLYIAVTAVLSLYISGKETGLVIDCGHGSTQAVPVYESVVMAHAVQTVPVAGIDVDAELVRLLAAKDIGGGILDCPRDVSAMKQAVCYVAQDFEAERVAAVKDGEPVRRSYTLPDGKAVSVASERFVASEVLFTPSLCGHDFAPGLGDAAQRAITYCDATLRPDLVNNIVLSGGCTMLPGFVDRFTTELQARLAPKQAADVSVPKLPERRYGAWIGGSILASLPLFDSLCVTNAEYEEQGPSFIHRKCG